ncbi:MAG: type II secretion system F family protein [Actinomycetota bacterium]
MRSVVAVLGALGLLLLYDGLTAAGSAHSSPLAGLDRLAAEAGLPALSGSRMLLASAGASVVALVVVAGITASFVLAAAFSVVASWIPFAWARARRRSRTHSFREAWPDAIASVIAGVRAGISLPETCASLAERGPQDLRPGFTSFAATYAASGSFHAALDRLRSELSDPVGDRVVASLGLAHDVGGTDLVRVLRTLSDFVREDLRVRKEVQARWSWTVTAARVAAAAPWIVLLLMSARPEAAAAFNSSTGAIVVATGAVVTTLGYRLMLRAARLPEPGRLSG